MPIILLTGGNGMVGQNVIAAAKDSKWTIIAPSRAELDLTDSAKVQEYVTNISPDIIVHAAGKVGGIAANIAAPVQFFDDNLIIGRNVVMSAFRAGVRNLINLGSTCIYPRKGKNPLEENLILTGELEPTNEGYALAKIATLRLCQYLCREHPELNYKTLIPCNLYGPFDKFNPEQSHLIPAIIHKIHHAKLNGNENVDIWGTGEARREFMYAEDLALFILNHAGSVADLPDVMNIGVGKDHSINEYYDAVAKAIGWNGKYNHDLTKPVGMAQKLCAITLQTNLGWKPQTSLEIGIAKTYEFYLSSGYA